MADTIYLSNFCIQTNYVNIYFNSILNEESSVYFITNSEKQASVYLRFTVISVHTMFCPTNELGLDTFAENSPFAVFTVVK